MTNDIKILSCPQCGFPRIRDCGNGLYQCDDCGAHFDKDENVVLTNEEWFCSLPTEEKAEWLTSTFDLCGAGCGNCFVIDKCNNSVGICPTDYITAWLKEVHKE